MNLIGVAGQIAQGKDVFSDYLVKKLNVDVYQEFIRGVGDHHHSNKMLWSRVAFADGLKKVMMDAFGENLEFVETWKRIDDFPPGYIMTVRQALQFIGDGFRKIKPNVWIELALRHDTPKVLSDVRYINEAEAIKAKGGVNVLLWRPGFENNVDHPSEAQIKPYVAKFASFGVEGQIDDPLFDLFIVNEGTLKDLYSKVDDIVIPYIKEKSDAR